MNKKLICRVCKYEGANVHWNDTVPAASQIISFKECYYKYTHLNEHGKQH